jgi:hypothetical protein
MRATAFFLRRKIITNNFDRFKVDWPEGSVGDWTIERHTVTIEDEQAQRIRLWNPTSLGRFTPAGTYTGLKRDGELIMSDSPDEIEDLMPFIDQAHGRVLINGLGLGVGLKAILDKTNFMSDEPSVTHVDVVEIDPDVITLVGPNFGGDSRVHIWRGDAFTYHWQPGTTWDSAWHDIWDAICTENLIGMKRLHRRYGKRVGWQGSWCRSLCEYQQRHNSGW